MSIKYDPEKDEKKIRVAIIGAGKTSPDDLMLINALKKHTGKIVVVESCNSSKDLMRLIKRIKPVTPLIVNYIGKRKRFKS